MPLFSELRRKKGIRKKAIADVLVKQEQMAEDLENKVKWQRKKTEVELKVK